MQATLEQIADQIAANGRHGKRSMLAGKWKWTRADKNDLLSLLASRGCPQEETDEFYKAKFNLKSQIEWLAERSETAE
jgi:hypothetical protein